MLAAASLVTRSMPTYTHTHIHTQQAKEQVKTECTQTQECEKWMGRNPIYKLKSGDLVGV